MLWRKDRLISIFCSRFLISSVTYLFELMTSHAAAMSAWHEVPGQTLHSTLWIFPLPSINIVHQWQNICTDMTSSPETLHNWWCISTANSFFALKKQIGLHIAQQVAIRSGISMVLGSLLTLEQFMATRLITECCHYTQTKISCLWKLLDSLVFG